MLVCTALGAATPSVAAADVDVHVDVRVQSPALVPVIEPPPPPAPPPPPRRYVSLGGTYSIATADTARNESSNPGYSARLEVDLASDGPWVAGATFVRGNDHRFRSDGSSYDGAEMNDTRVFAYVAHAARRGRLEVRGAAALGFVSSSVERWSSSMNPGYTDHELSAIVEASGLVSVDLFERVALGVGAVVTSFDQTFASTTGDRGAVLHRGLDVSMQSSLRWAL